jgi:hypothetical protein
VTGVLNTAYSSLAQTDNLSYMGLQARVTQRDWWGGRRASSSSIGRCHVLAAATHSIADSEDVDVTVSVLFACWYRMTVMLGVGSLSLV